MFTWNKLLNHAQYTGLRWSRFPSFELHQIGKWLKITKIQSLDTNAQYTTDPNFGQGNGARRLNQSLCPANAPQDGIDNFLRDRRSSNTV